ncbi:hypothetical protein [Auraticoccus monumenti]|uniref:Uncharacterized protein n=1 Tax=Auraticoccus monumenti TaxID=675864 RepID=A0A1G6UM57_9ACTN|nr:hypothetical protein [Auraticoccus monumenti]SDD42361.1 hypothetical protein SAMN04489747_0918 [Auraticoccus monumenti]
MSTTTQPDPQPYLTEVAPDIYQRPEPVTLDEHLRFLAASGLAAAATSLDQLPDRELFGIELRAAWQQWHLNFHVLSGSFVTHLLLTELREADPERAARVSQRIIEEYDFGDTFGEWLFHWTSQYGLDAERITSEARAAVQAANDGAR